MQEFLVIAVVHKYKRKLMQENFQHNIGLVSINLNIF